MPSSRSVAAMGEVSLFCRRSDLSSELPGRKSWFFLQGLDRGYCLGRQFRRGRADHLVSDLLDWKSRRLRIASLVIPFSDAAAPMVAGY